MNIVLDTTNVIAIRTVATSKVEIEAQTWKDEQANVVLPVGTKFEILLLGSPNCLNIEVKGCEVDLPPARFVVVGSDSNRKDLTEFEVDAAILSEMRDRGWSLASSKDLSGQVYDNDDETGEANEPFETLHAAGSGDGQDLNPMALLGRE